MALRTAPAQWHAVGLSLADVSLTITWMVLTAALWPALGQTAAPPEHVLPTPKSPGATAHDPNGIRDGVLLPTAGADPGIRAPLSPPAIGTLSIVPPPGTPGGNSTVQPR